MGIRPTPALWATFAAVIALSLPGATTLQGAARAGDKSTMTTQRKGSGLPIPRFASLLTSRLRERGR